MEMGAGSEGGRGNTTRPYRMRARREAVERTREAVLRAAFGLWTARPYDEVTLDDVAAAAGVSRQTVHRHFGTKDELLVAVTDWRRPREDAADRDVPPGDVDAAVRHQVDRHERMGDAVVRFLALEGRIEAVDYLLAHGRRAHRTWLERVFASQLPTDPVGREQIVLALYAATDVMVWKLLRRDFGRSRDEVEAVVRRLVAGVLAGTATPAGGVAGEGREGP